MTWIALTPWQIQHTKDDSTLAESSTGNTQPADRTRGSSVGFFLEQDE